MSRHARSPKPDPPRDEGHQGVEPSANLVREAAGGSRGPRDIRDLPGRKGQALGVVARTSLRFEIAPAGKDNVIAIEAEVLAQFIDVAATFAPDSGRSLRGA